MKKIIITLLSFVVLHTLMFLGIGCSSNASKGDGPLFTYKTEMRIGEAPASHQFGLNNALRRGAGPADTIATHTMPDPTTKPVVKVVTNDTRAARN